ncbi:hypothetical protein P7H17_01040 [Paenibacillus larvae]|nr:hypothetical protein [Paenibacillus larvae]MDT2284977.1 hypothetical protein [Paenibacillus larvae]
MYLLNWGKRKSVILSMAFFMALTSFVSIGLNPVVAAERSDSQTELVAIVVKDNLERIGDLLKVKDKQKLKQDLEENNLELSVQDIQSQVDNFNTMLLGLQGQDKKEQLSKALQEVENEIVKAERAGRRKDTWVFCSFRRIKFDPFNWIWSSSTCIRSIWSSWFRSFSRCWSIILCRRFSLS